MPKYDVISVVDLKVIDTVECSLTTAVSNTMQCYWEDENEKGFLFRNCETGFIEVTLLTARMFGSQDGQVNRTCGLEVLPYRIKYVIEDGTYVETDIERLDD